MLDKVFLQRLLEMIERCSARNIAQSTDFLDPATQKETLAFCQAQGVRFCFEGGYPGAERRIVCLLPEYQEVPEIEDLLVCFSVYSPKPLSHPDLLGALIGLGVKRNVIGDLCIVEDERGRGVATVYCLQRVAPLLLSLPQVGRQTVTCQKIPFAFSKADTHSEESDPITGSVASLRLDAVLGMAFHLPRSQSTLLIDAGEVQLNWKECRERSRLLRIGDSISVRRHGRAILQSVEGQSRKGRQIITISVYVKKTYF